MLPNEGEKAAPQGLLCNKEREQVKTEKKEISNSLLCHAHTLAIVASQEIRMLQIVWLKNTILNKVKQNNIIHAWNCPVKCQLVYLAELFFQ